MSSSMLVQENGGQTPVKTAHSLHIDRRRHTTVTGVSDVCSYHETEIVLKLEAGLMVFAGQNLHIGRLLLEEGKLEVDGHIDSVVYESPRKSAGFTLPFLRRKK